MWFVDFPSIINKAWEAYGNPRKIKSITDISAKVSTNSVYKVQFSYRKFVIAKLSFFGKYEHFKEDHNIINNLAYSLPPPFQNTLAHSLTKNDEVFTFRYQEDEIDVWVVFYQPVKIKEKLPPRLKEKHIIKLAKTIGKFHKSCFETKGEIPKSTKTFSSDISDLYNHLDTQEGKYEFGLQIGTIKKHCEIFLKNQEEISNSNLIEIPVFVDWNIGNFSITKSGQLYSRWDYDWFRIGSRVLDFYFFSRVVSDIGDKTTFSYLMSTLQEERFILFLQEYHKVFPLSIEEIKFIKEAYRFFILNYVLKDGNRFFHQFYANKLQKEAYEIYLPSLDSKFDEDKLVKALNL
ncbi:MAG: hypothetical protein KTR26_16275 [Flammeovirgaceae bacterium]|nr:hypothetical protein [Flammeovirgaceae bacterium]